MATNPKELEIYPTMMLIRFIERGLINTELENSSYIIISSYPNRIEELQGLIPERRRLLMSFREVEEEEANSFTEEMAQKIFRFVLDDDSITRIYICCDDGQTRSCGIACALYRYYGNADMESIIWRSPHACPNLLVFRLVSEALGMEISMEEIEKLREIRETALQNAIEIQTNIGRDKYRYGLNSRVSMEKKLAYFCKLSAMEENRAINWKIKKDTGELSILTSDTELMMLCTDIVANSLEFVWFYGLTAEDLGVISLEDKHIDVS